MPVDRHAKRMLDFLAAAGAGRTGAPSAEERRQTLRALSQSAEAEPAPVGRVEDLAIPAGHGAIPVRIYAGSTASPSSALVYFHGGGWVAGGLDTHDGFCRRLANSAACQVLAVDFRLAPEHPFPAALEDCLTAFQWVATNARLLGIEPSRLAIGGDSTGAGLAAAVCMLLRERDGPRPALQVLICPVLDVLRDTGSRHALGQGYFVEPRVFERDLRDYCPEGVDPRDSRVSPLMATDFAGLPAAIVHTAEFDPFCDEGQAYACALAQAKVAAREVRHAGMIHYFYAMARTIPYAEQAARMIGSDIRAALGGVDEA